MTQDRNRILEAATDAGCASAEDGIVLLDGPRGIAVAMTPQAAEKTGDSLKEAAAEAQKQIDSGVDIKSQS